MTPLAFALSLLVNAGPAQTPPAAPARPAAAATAASQDPVAAHKAWHQERLRRLTSEDGWLTLVGLHWLHEGESVVGSAPGSDIRLPASAPGTVGTLKREGKFVTFTPKAGVDVRVGGKPFVGGALGSDAAGGKPDVLEVGSVRFHLISRQGRLGLRVRDSASAGRRNFKPFPLFAYNPAWRVEARLEPGGPGKLAVPNIIGTVEDMPSPGTLVFTIEGKEHRLVPVVEEGDDQLFLVFADESNRKDTYVSGRFLYAPPPVDGKTVLDFNRATNPPCAFTQFATCPLPPRVNRLAVRVEAGEKRAGQH